MNVRGYIVSGLALVGLSLMSVSAVAQNSPRIPTGHVYSPNNQRLPLFNTRQSKIEARADIYETEIYNTNRDTAVTFGNMGIFSNNDFLRGGSSNRPRY